jgi:hypothetical protein
MKRKIFLLMFVLVFLATDTALARRHPRRNCCCPTKCSSKDHAQAKEIYNYCLRDIYMEFPGPPHLYECLVLVGGCGSSTEEYDDLWYGYPTKPLAQSCPNCEFEDTGSKWRGGQPAPGHGHPFNRARACQWLKDHYPEGTSVTCKYYAIQAQGHPTYHVPMVKAHAPNAPAVPVRYFGVQVTRTEGNWDNLSVTNAKKRGHVLTFDFTDDSGASARGLVWLE